MKKKKFEHQAISNLFICRALNRSQAQAKLLRRGTTTSEEIFRKRDIRYQRKIVTNKLERLSVENIFQVVKDWNVRPAGERQCN